MVQILQRDLFVRRLSIYRARISRWISRWISMWIWSSDFRVTPCKGIQDGLGFWIPRYGFPDSSTGFLIVFKLELGFLYSNRLWDSGFIELDSGFQSPGFRITQTNLFRTPDSSSKTFHPYMGWCEKYASCFRSEGFVHYSSLLHLQFRYRCHLCGCGRLRVDETLPINKWFE